MVEWFLPSCPPPAVLCLFLAKVTHPGPGYHWCWGCTRALHNKKLLMLLSWLGATLAYSPECLAEVPAGDRGILPSPRRFPPVQQALHSPGWAVVPVQRLQLALGRAEPCARGPSCLEWLQHTRAALHSSGRGAKGRGWHRQGCTHRCFVTQHKPGVSADNTAKARRIFLGKRAGGFEMTLPCFSVKPRSLMC